MNCARLRTHLCSITKVGRTIFKIVALPMGPAQRLFEISGMLTYLGNIVNGVSGGPMADKVTINSAATDFSHGSRTSIMSKTFELIFM